MSTTFNEEKFAELILYVARKCERDPHFGARKLNKILFYSDFLSYATYGEAITGAEYKRQEFGPVPAKLVPVRNRLRDEKALVLQENPMFDGHIQKRVISLRQAKTKLFGGQEVDLVMEVIKQLWDKDGNEVSDLTHHLSGWKLTATNATIPYASVFIPETPIVPTRGDLEWARTAAERFLS